MFVYQSQISCLYLLYNVISFLGIVAPFMHSSVVWLYYISVFVGRKASSLFYKNNIVEIIRCTKCKKYKNYIDISPGKNSW